MDGDRSARLEAAVAQWMEAVLVGEAPDLGALARHHDVTEAELTPLLENARWLVGRHRGATAPTTRLPVPPFSLGEFEVLEEAGRGGMGVVFRATQSALGRTVAIKVLDPGQPDRSQQRHARFLREAQAAARLQHSHIVRVLTVGETDGLAWFAMDWIEGESLSQILDRHRRERTAVEVDGAGRRAEFSFRESAALLAKVSRALQHAHEQGLLHRDIKPGNILVDTRGEPHLADFGLVRDLDEATLTATGDVVGSPPYMSPEQLLGERTVSVRSDVYSLGVTFYECLTLRRPFQADSVSDLRQKILTAQVTLPRLLDTKIPEDLQWICSKAMARETAVRYPSAAALAADLEAYLRGEPVMAGPPSVPLRLRRLVRRRARWVVGVLVLVLLAGIVGIWQSLRQQADRAHLAVTRKQIAIERMTEERGQLLATLNRAVAEYPDEPSLRHERAIQLLAEGRVKEAQADVQAAARLDRQFEPLVRQLDEAIAISRGDPQASSDHLVQQLTGVDDAVPNLLHWRGLMLMYLGHWESAVNSLARASELDRSLSVECELAVCYRRLGRINEALATLERLGATREFPQLGYYRCRIAASASDSGRAASELAVLEQRAPNSPYTAAARILVGALNGMNPEAAQGHLEAAKPDPVAADLAEHSLAYVYHAANQPVQAIRIWEAKLARRPHDIAVRSTLGVTYYQLADQRRGEMRADFRKKGQAMLERAASDSAHLPTERDFHRGMQHWFSGEFEEAVLHLRRAVVLIPKDPTRWRPLAVALLSLADRTQDPRQRLELIVEHTQAQCAEAELVPANSRATMLARQSIQRVVDELTAAGDARAAQWVQRLQAEPR